MSEQAPLWAQLLTRYKPGLARKQADIALEILKKECLGLWRGNSDATLTAESAKKLRGFLEQGAALREQRFRVKFINQGLRIGAKDLGWEINVLPREIPLKLEASPFNSKTFKLLTPVRQLEKAFLADLAISPDTSSPIARMYGQLLLSAIIFGGLLHTDWLDAWYRGIPQGIRLDKNCLWIEMRRRVSVHVPIKSGKNEETHTISIGRRWHADPMTEALLYRALPIIASGKVLPEEISDSSMGRVAPKAWGYLLGYLKHLGFGSTKLVKNLSSLTAGIKVRLGLGISQALVGYASGELKSVSLPPAAWTRLISGKSVPTAKEAEMGATVFKLGPVMKALRHRPGHRSDMAVQETIISELRDALYESAVKGKERKFNTKPAVALKAISTVIQNRRDDMCPVLELISVWLEHLLAPSGSGKSMGRRGKARQPSSVGRYLSAIGSVLVATELEKDLAYMSQDELAEMYEEAAEGKKSTDEQRYALTVMARFHGFLIEGFGLSPVMFADLPGRGPIEASVAANLISSDCFRLVIHVLGFSRKDLPRTREVALLLAILGFRCGLREGEGRFLLLSDIQGNIDVELLIRKNENFRPKTSSGTRRLPLTLLLEEDELCRLLVWRSKRLQEGASPLDPLFTQAANSSNVVTYSETIEPVRDALRQVTGDNTLVYHSLRHSAASWLLIRLVLPLDSQHWCQFSFFQGPEYDIGRLKSLRRGILGFEDASRKCFYAVALLLGHSSPSVTLGKYVHLMDWLLWLELSDRRNAVNLSEKELLAITGLSRSQIWHDRKSLDKTTWTVNSHLPSLRRQWATCLSDPLSRKAKGYDTALLDDTLFSGKKYQVESSSPDWRVYQRIMNVCQRYPHRILDQAETYGFTEIQIKAWLGEAAAIAGMQTVYGVPRHRRGDERIGIESHTQGDCQLSGAASAAGRFPLTPRLRQDLSLVDQIFRRYQNIDQSERAIIDFGVDFFLRHFSASKRGIRCYRFCQARRYLEFLTLLDVPQAFVRVEVLPPKDMANSEVPDLVLQWSNTLRLTLDQFRVIKKYDHGRRDTGSVLIQVAGTEEILLLSAKAAIKKIKQMYRAQDSYGFRYALYLIAIVRNGERLAVA